MVKSINAINYNLNILNDKNAKVNTALSSGEALEYGSDDSVLYGHILGIQSDKNTYSAIQEHITLSQSYNTTSDNVLAQVKSTTESIIANLVKANTDTSAQDDREIIAIEMQDLKDSLLSLANTNVDGKYIFSGVNTETQPFALDPNTGVVSYQSDNSIKKLNVEEATYVSQGVNGIDAFYYTNNNVTAGSTYTFVENDTFVDADGNSWTYADSDGDLVFDGLFLDGDLTTTPLPVTDNGDGTFSAVVGGTFTFTDNEIVIDDNEEIWSLVDIDNDNVFDGLYLNGDTTTTPIDVVQNADGTYTATNMTTQSFEVKHSIFDDLDEVIAALKLEDTDGNSISSADAKNLLNLAQERIRNDAYDAQNISHSVLGTRTNTINSYGDVVSAKILNLTKLDEEYASADLTRLAVQAQSLENTYAALYSTINRVNGMSLVNYLR